MNATHPHVTLVPPAPATASQRVVPTPLFTEATSRYRKRGLGVGYGSSSGYALDKRYTSDWGQARFHCR